MTDSHTEASFIGASLDAAIDRLTRSERELERRASIGRLDLDASPRGDDVPGGWSVLPAWIACDPTLSPEARVVLLVLSSHADDHTHPFPSIGRLARMVGRSERTILRVLSELEARGLVQRMHRFRGGEQVSSAYVLRFDRWGRGGVSRVTYRGDTDVAPRGDTGVAPRGDTGVVQIKTMDQDQGKRIQTPPSPPAVAGGTDTRGDRIRRIAREEGLRPRDARRLLEHRERLAGLPEDAGVPMHTPEEIEALREEAERLFGGGEHGP